MNVLKAVIVAVCGLILCTIFAGAAWDIAPEAGILSVTNGNVLYTALFGAVLIPACSACALISISLIRMVKAGRIEW